MRRSVGDKLAWMALALTLLVPVWWGADANAPWDLDNLAPGSVLKALAVHFGPGWYSSYGPLPYYLMAAACAPVLLVMKLVHELGHPSNAWPWGFRHPDASMAVLVVAARLTTVASALALAWRESRRARDGRADVAPWLVPLLLLGSAQFAFYGRTSNADVHALFWLVLAVGLAESARGSLKRICGAGAAAAAAVCCKEQVGPAAAVVAGACVVEAWRLPGGTRERLRALAAVAAAGLGTYALLWQLPVNLSGWRAHYAFLWQEALYPRTFPATPAGFAGLAARAASYAPLALGWPILAGLVLALVRRVSPRGLGLRALVVLAYLVGFLGRIGYVYPRFLLPLLVLALPLAARGLAVPPGRRGAVAALVVALALSGGPLVSWLMLTDPRLGAERWLRAHAAPGEVVEVAGNAHFNVRPPEASEVRRVNDRYLADTPRPPVGDFVVLSSLDTVSLARDPAGRAAWWDALHDPAGAYAPAAEFARSPLAGWLGPMELAPGIRIYSRRPDGPPVAVPAPDAERGESGARRGVGS